MKDKAFRRRFFSQVFKLLARKRVFGKYTPVILVGIAVVLGLGHHSFWDADYWIKLPTMLD